MYWVGPFLKKFDPLTDYCCGSWLEFSWFRLFLKGLEVAKEFWFLGYFEEYLYPPYVDSSSFPLLTLSISANTALESFKRSNSSWVCLKLSYDLGNF